MRYLRKSLQGSEKMSKPTPASPVKLIISSIYSSKEDWLELIPRLEERFGRIDYSSKEMDFNWTDYYQREMGAPLFRQIISFERLIQPTELVAIKLFTNQLEQERAEQGRRKVNLDPGILSLDHLVLATGKPCAHRIYLGEGVWADLHLIYQSGSFQPLAWTYPDYRSQSYIALFNRLRELLKSQLKEVAGK